MRFKRPIYRILFYTAWLVMLGGVTALLIAANSKTKSRSCKGITVSINGGGDKIFVDKEDVLKTINKTTKGSVVHKPFSNINLVLLEKNLEANPWIRDAEVYFDTKDVLHVEVWERVPMARVFTTNGNSFYIDSAGYQLSLLENYSAKLPVITGFTPAKKFNARDSAMLQGVKQVVKVITENPFWNAQIGQIDITSEGKFELIPTIGSHVIKLGFADNIEEKLNRLMVFYKQVLPKAGLAKYSALDVEFDGQVVAVRKGPSSAVDSIQLQKNIQELMARKAAEQEPEDVAQDEADKKLASVETIENTQDTVATKPISKPVIQQEVTTVKTTTSPIKSTPRKTTQPQFKPIQKPKQQVEKQPTQLKKEVKKNVQKPKAVMERKVENEY